MSTEDSFRRTTAQAESPGPLGHQDSASPDNKRVPPSTPGTMGINDKYSSGELPDPVRIILSRLNAAWDALEDARNKTFGVYWPGISSSKNDREGMDNDSQSLSGYTTRDYEKALLSAGIINKGASVTIQSLRVFRLDTSLIKGLSMVTGGLGLILDSYSLYQGIKSRDQLRIIMSSHDLTISIATIVVGTKSPEAALTLTIINIAGKWAILSSSSKGIHPRYYYSGGGGASSEW